MRNKLQYIYSISVFMGVLLSSYMMMGPEESNRIPLQIFSTTTAEPTRQEAGVNDPVLNQLFEFEEALSTQVPDQAKKNLLSPYFLLLHGRLHHNRVDVTSLKMNAIFMSDVHLEDGTSLKTNVVIRFLQEKAARYENLFILGDLFDAWPSTSQFLLERFKPVLDTFRQLHENGTKVHYFEGNHDFHLGNYFKNDLGIEVYTDNAEFNWGGKKVFICHGDLGNPRDYGYRVLRGVLRSRAVKFGLKKVPGKWIHQLGEKSSRLSRNYQSNVGRNETAIRQTYREAAEKVFTKGYDYVLMGHTHLPDDVRTIVDGRECRYLNTGDWVKHFSYVEFDGERFYTKTHPVNHG